MKTKHFICIFILAFSAGICLSQQVGGNNVTVGYSYAQHEHMQTLGGPASGLGKADQPSIYFSYGRMLKSDFETVVYCRMLMAEYRTATTELEDRLVFSPGLALRYHLLHSIAPKGCRFDIYVSNSIGGTFAEGCKLEYGAGLGLSYYFLRNLGVNAEADFGEFTIARLGFTGTSNFMAQAGLTFRW